MYAAIKEASKSKNQSSILLNRSKTKGYPGADRMAKKSIKEEILPVPSVPSVPALVISEATASDFMKEINAVAVENPKQESFINNLVKATRKARVKKDKIEKVKPEQNDSVDKATLIAKITLNVNTFESLLKDFIQPNRETYLALLPKKSVPELEIIFKTLEHSRIVANSANQLKHMLFLGASALELATRSIGLKTQGYAQALRAQEDEIRMILQEIAIERAETMAKYQRPEVRLAVILTSTLMSMDNANRMRELNKSVIDKPLEAAVEEQYKDL